MLQGHRAGARGWAEREHLLGGKAIDHREHDEFCGGEAPVLPFDAVQPASGDAVRRIAPLLREPKAAFFHLTQGELPLYSCRAELAPDAVHDRSPKDQDTRRSVRGLSNRKTLSHPIAGYDAGRTILLHSRGPGPPLNGTGSLFRGGNRTVLMS